MGLPSPESNLGSQVCTRVPALGSLMALFSVASGDSRVPPSAVFLEEGSTSSMLSEGKQVLRLLHQAGVSLLLLAGSRALRCLAPRPSDSQPCEMEESGCIPAAVLSHSSFALPATASRTGATVRVVSTDQVLQVGPVVTEG